MTLYSIQGGYVPRKKHCHLPQPFKHNNLSHVFFYQSVWTCGYWRWKEFRQQCDGESRIGETCGLKLVYESRRENRPCDVCCSAEKKLRQITRLHADIER